MGVETQNKKWFHWNCLGWRTRQGQSWKIKGCVYSILFIKGLSQPHWWHGGGTTGETLSSVLMQVAQLSWPMEAARMHLMQTSCAGGPKFGLCTAPTGTELPVLLLPELPYHPREASLLKKDWVCYRTIFFFVCGAAQMSHLQTAVVLFVFPCPGKVQCWEEKTNPRQEPPYTHCSSPQLIPLQVCRNEARNVWDGDKMAREDCKIRHLLIISRFAFSWQALLLV